MRIWPAPVRPPGELLLHAVNSPESMTRAIARGLPAIMARPLSPFAEQVEELGALPGWRSPPPASIRRPCSRARPCSSTPSSRRRRAEARDAGARRRSSGTWQILQHLTTPTTREMPRGYELYERRGGRLPEYAYEDWLEHVLLFDDPDGCAEKVARLRDAGVERLLLWMGVGGVDARAGRALDASLRRGGGAAVPVTRAAPATRLAVPSRLEESGMRLSDDDRALLPPAARASSRRWARA